MKEAVHVYLDIAFFLFFMLLLWCRIFLILVVVVVWLFGVFFYVFFFFLFFELLREGGYRVLPVLSFILPEEKKKVVRCDVNRKL